MRNVPASIVVVLGLLGTLNVLGALVLIESGRSLSGRQFSAWLASRQRLLDSGALIEAPEKVGQRDSDRWLWTALLSDDNLRRNRHATILAAVALAQGGVLIVLALLLSRRPRESRSAAG